MPLKVKESARAFALQELPFAWGFDNGDPNSIVPTAEGDRLPMCAPARMLLRSLASAGWGAEGVCVALDIHDGERRGAFRYVRDVSATHNGKPFKIEFFSSIWAEGEDFMPGAASSFTYDGETFPYSQKHWKSEHIDLFEDAVFSLADQVSRYPKSPLSMDIGPAGDANIRRAFHVDAIPLSDGFPTLYARLPYEMFHRRRKGQVLGGYGYRLTTDTLPEDRELLPERYFDCFDYATTDPYGKTDSTYHTDRDSSLPVEVKLKSLNEIYVMDMWARDEARQVLETQLVASGRNRASKEESIRVSCAAPKTMVAAHEYRGGFKRPVYCLGRQLMADEARVMDGNLKVDYDWNVGSVSVQDRVTGLTVPITSYDRAGPLGLAVLVRTAEKLSYCLGTEVELSEEASLATADPAQIRSRREAGRTIGSTSP